MNNSAIERLRRPMPARRDVSPWDPSAVFLIKALLYPSVATGCLGLALWICGEPFRQEYFLLAVLAFLATAEVLDSSPLQYPAARRFAQSLAPITAQWLLVVGFLWTLLALSGFTEHFEPRVLLTWAGITPVALACSRLCTQLVFRLFGVRHMPPRNAVIIGRNELGALLERRMREDASLRINVLGYFDDLPSGAAPASRDALLGEPAQLARYIAQHAVRLVYITWPMTRESRILDLLESLRDSTVSIYFVPDVSVASLIQSRVDLLRFRHAHEDAGVLLRARDETFTLRETLATLGVPNAIVSNDEWNGTPQADHRPQWPIADQLPD